MAWGSGHNKTSGTRHKRSALFSTATVISAGKGAGTGYSPRLYVPQRAAEVATENVGANAHASLTTKAKPRSVDQVMSAVQRTSKISEKRHQIIGAIF